MTDNLTNEATMQRIYVTTRENILAILKLRKAIGEPTSAPALLEMLTTQELHRLQAK